MSDEHPPGLEPEALRRHLDAARPGLVQGPLSARLIEGGKSNLTYVVTDGTTQWVVRRPPLGHVLATAHDMSREFRVISALHPTSVPVPEPLLLCEDTEVLGAPFYVMEFVAGTCYRTARQLSAIGPERTRDVVHSLVDTLVELHAVDPAAVGLADFGRPDGYLERQLRRWGKQLQASRSRDLPGIDELHERLAKALPDSGAPTVIHGDYKLDNVLVADGTGGGIAGDGITAVLDWEMSTLGDPLSDLGLLAMYSSRDAGPGAAISNTGAAPGHPAVGDLIERYAARSGRDVSAIAWYCAFAYFKLAVIAEGIHYRFTLGQTVGAGFDGIGEMVPLLIDRGLTTLQEG